MDEAGLSIYGISAFVSLAGLFFGMDTGSIGPITVMPRFLETFKEFRSHAIQGLLVATILISASVTSFFSGWMSDKLSRKRTIMIGSFISSLGSALEAASVHTAMLIVGRLIAGVGEGMFLSAAGVYLIEISPPKLRGRISTMLQLFITLGIMSGYFICYGTTRWNSSLSWRTPFIVQSCVTFVLGAGMEFLPYSPRWLIQVGRIEEAMKVMDQFNTPGAEQEKVMNEARGTDGRSEASLRETFAESTTKWRTILAMFPMGMQQLSGIDAVLYFAPLIFTQAGLSSQQSSFLASGISGIVLVVSTIPAQLYLMDKWGRRPSSIWGGALMSVCMIAIGMLYATGGSKTFAGKWTIISLIYVFVILFSITWAIVIKLFIIEVQPPRTRAIASSLSHSANWIVNLCVALTTPLFLAKSPSGPYFLFGACLLITTIVCMLFVPETLGRSLNDIDAVWDARADKSRALFKQFGHGHHGRRMSDDGHAVELT
ncbi:hypothetical protein FRC03_007965 [Tulasnella sp. 419]|nr:hypothetical protein FRC03_007965 [Tulasnella sp. 419]